MRKAFVQAPSTANEKHIKRHKRKDEPTARERVSHEGSRQLGGSDDDGEWQEEREFSPTPPAHHTFPKLHPPGSALLLPILALQLGLPKHPGWANLHHDNRDLAPGRLWTIADNLHRGAVGHTGRAGKVLPGFSPPEQAKELGNTPACCYIKPHARLAMEVTEQGTFLCPRK